MINITPIYKVNVFEIWHMQITLHMHAKYCIWYQSHFKFKNEPQWMSLNEHFFSIAKYQVINDRMYASLLEIALRTNIILFQWITQLVMRCTHASTSAFIIIDNFER